MYIVNLWIEHPVRGLDQTFSYLYERELAAGLRVQVDFNGRRLIGFVESSEPADADEAALKKRYGYALKYIDDVLDEEPLLTEELHDLAMWMADTTLSPRIACFQAMLPGKVKPQSGRESAVKENWVRISETEVSLTPKQLEAYLYVRDHQPLRYAELRKVYPNQARQLLEKGAAVLESREREAVSLALEETSDSLVLNDVQTAAMKEIESSEDPVFLLHGVTGSGKTEIYLQMAEKALKAGRQVLILVPEIGLTPQMIERVRNRFGMDLAIYHSALNAQEKYEQYRKVKTGRAAIVVGTRSAVFLPFRDLGLIVLDEEHDSSYKQENQPAYHCRDVAIWRGRYHGCKVILGSATPSLESYARGIRRVYHLVHLQERVNRTMPEIEVVPLKEALQKGDSYILTKALEERMQEALARRKQVILLLNRRGYSTQMRCRSCQEVIVCPQCDLAMSYHRDEKIMKCHACGTVMRLPKYCPSCGQAAGYSSYGFGTQRLEQDVQECFPQARILRMDADTTAAKNSHQKILERFGRKEADILLGTQMIAKGLDYPDVTLVGIINGDEGLSRTDYRSCETTFDLLMQASGRSGRSEDAGRVVLQVYDPDHYAVQCAVQQNYESFFVSEMRFRHAGQYPPYTYMISLTVIGRSQKEADETAGILKAHLQNEAYKTIGVIALLKIQDRFRSRILLKGKDLDVMRRDVRRALEDPQVSPKHVRIDVNPMTLD
ncbi:MAG: primosomal protein N' [Solobacterium sp.]|nr:primosomal protein N' [Solobacterium sp.]